MFRATDNVFNSFLEQSYEKAKQKKKNTRHNPKPCLPLRFLLPFSIPRLGVENALANSADG